LDIFTYLFISIFQLMKRVFFGTKIRKTVSIFSVLLLTTGIRFYRNHWRFETEKDLENANSIIEKEKIIIVGSGWAAVSLLEELNPLLYDITVCSPRNYFLFTPLLPSACVGSIEPRSISQPIRKILPHGVKFYEASVTSIDPNENSVCCEDVSDFVSTQNNRFKLHYDKLILAVGSEPNTFGCKGVKENCFFISSVEQVKKIRERVIDCLETASYPGVLAQERKQLCHFVVVGGGPTGAEFAAETADWIHENLAPKFPFLKDDIKVSIIQSGDHLLNTYSKKISEYTEKTFKREGIEMIMDSKVVEVGPRELKVQSNKTSGKATDDVAASNSVNTSIPYGLCIWSAGIKPTELALNLIRKIPENQTNKMALLTDEFLQVKGSKNIWAIGDCATIEKRKLLPKMKEIFLATDANGDGYISRSEWKDFCKGQKCPYPQLSFYFEKIEGLFDQFDMDGNHLLDWNEFESMLKHLDSNLINLPATAAIATQQGRYLGKQFNLMARQSNHMENLKNPFQPKFLGSFAYVGRNKAVLDVGEGLHLSGFAVWLSWRAFYFSSQVSWECRAKVALDWLRTFAFGRDISRQ